MKKLILILLIILKTIIWADTAIGFQSGLYDKSISVSIGTDFSIATLNIRYDQLIEITKIEKNFTYNAGFSIPLFNPDFKDFKISTGVLISPVIYKSIHIPTSLKLLFRSNANAAFSATGFGTEIGLFPGVYTNNIVTSAEFIWDSQIATYIKHSDYYQNTIYKNALNGWYGFTSNVFRFGGRIAKIIEERNEIIIRGGYEYHKGYNLKIPPFYALVGNNYRF